MRGLVAGVPATITTARGRIWITVRRWEWLLSLVILVLGIVVVDVFLSRTQRVPTLADQRDRSLVHTYNHYAGYRLVPKRVLRDGEEPLYINSRGFRGPEIAPDKVAGVTRIAFLGGPQVFDYHGGDWPARTGALLRAGGRAVEVITAAVRGNTSFDSLSKLATDLWTLDLDAVVVCHGWNDAKYFTRISAAEPYRGLPEPTPMFMGRDWRLYPRGLERLLVRSAIYRLVRTRLLDVLVTSEGVRRWDWTPSPGSVSMGSAGPRQFEINMKLLARMIDEIGAVGVFCRQATLASGTTEAGVDVADYAQRNLQLTAEQRREALTTVDAIVTRVAIESGMHLLDMNAALSNRLEFFRDGVHFSPEGSAATAALTAELLAAALANR
ncbi:MAG: GDSL-type esterase/lipase family protein [Gammaproteobacteria bacterium]|nr:GDSL-type esterase/lipase family protein [Gammaproteobacteria bacterium]MDJ0890773.1 GDSL-type esterase/lipase family protein [Gammaproteobacteria bacterium]